MKDKPKAYGKHLVHKISDENAAPKETIVWELDRMDEEIIFWSEAPTGWADGHSTQVWKYVYRDGSFAFSNPEEEDPTLLEFFADWDSAEGDIIEPTPYGNEFDMFLLERQTFFMA